MDIKNIKIGWIGLGNMGHPMAKNLEKAGYNLTVYNRSAEKSEDFKVSSKIAASISELVTNADIIFTIVTNDAAVESIYKEALQISNLHGKLFIDMSTISQELSVSTSQQIRAAGASFIDAPVAGSTKPAQEGTLIIMAGGDVEDIAKATPYLEKLGRLIKHVGENGKGIAAKLSVNYFLAILYQGLAETTLFAGHQGIDRADILEIINESAAGSGATKVKTPLLIEDTYRPAFALDLMLKDILLAKSNGADFALTDALINTYKAAQDKGFGKHDVIGIIKYLENNK